jgi:DNA-binding MarR family transcriptional regulator
MDPRRAERRKAALDLRGTVLFQLSRTYRSLRRALAQDHRRYGLYEGRDLVLIEIARQGGAARPRSIGRTVGMAPSSLSTILRRSEAVGYTTREADPADGRTFRAGLTAIGRICAEDMAAAWQMHESSLTSALTPAERAELARLLAKVEGVLEETARQEAAEARAVDRFSGRD